jgi:hypothetical protein
MVRHAVSRPLASGCQQRLLHGVLGKVEVPVAPHEPAEDLRRQPTQEILDIASILWPSAGHDASGHPTWSGRCSSIGLTSA